MPDTIMTAFLFGLELEMQVELLKRDKNDEIDTLEHCIAAAFRQSPALQPPFHSLILALRHPPCRRLLSWTRRGSSLFIVKISLRWSCGGCHGSGTCW